MSPLVSRVGVRFQWNGDAITDRMRRAVEDAVEYTMEKCVMHAKGFHDYGDRTGHATKSIRIEQHAHPTGPFRVSGTWGGFAAYSLYLEIGTSRPDSGAPRAGERARLGHGNMWAIPPPLPTGPHTDTQWVNTAVAGSVPVPGSDRHKIPGRGPLMEPRMSLRPAAQWEYPQLAARIHAFYFSKEVR